MLSDGERLARTFGYFSAQFAVQQKGNIVLARSVRTTGGPDPANIA
jgi:hypothetical protein